MMPAFEPGGLQLHLRPTLRSSGTAVLPSPNSHSPWYNIWGQGIWSVLVSLWHSTRCFFIPRVTS